MFDPNNPSELPDRPDPTGGRRQRVQFRALRAPGRRWWMVMLVVGWLSLIGSAQPALAQDPGTIPPAIVNASSSLTADQKARVKSFVDAQIAQMASGEAERAARARSELVGLAVRPGASEVFLREYAAAIRAGLEPILAGNDSHKAVNALVVIQSLRTPEAIELLLKHADVQQEPRLPVRIRAMSSLAEAIPSAPMTPVQIDGVVRRLLALGQRETNWVALHHAFRALVRIASMPRLPDDSAKGAIRAQTDLIDSLVDRVGKEAGRSDLIGALANNLNLVVREQLPTMKADQARLLRTRLAKAMTLFLSAVERDWKATRAARADLARFYASAVSVAELLLKVAASSDAQQPLNADFGRHWEADDQQKFSADVQKAKQIVDRLPAS